MSLLKKKKGRKEQVLARMWKNQNPLHTFENETWCHSYGKEYGGFSRNLNRITI